MYKYSSLKINRSLPDLFNYILGFLLIGQSGITILSSAIKLLVITFVVAALLFYHLNRKIDKIFIYFVFFLLIMVIGQTIKFSSFFWITTSSLFIRFIYPYLVIKIIGRKFIDVLINIIYFLTIISFIFYFPSLFSSDIHEIVKYIGINLGIDKFNDYQSFIIYSWEPFSKGYLRNSGPFWEPGGFACYLILVTMLNTIKSEKILNKRNVVFIIGIITTFSTAGYIALMLLLFFFATFNSQLKWKFLLIPLIIAISWYSYFVFDFMEEKIDHQFEIALTPHGYVNKGRVGSGLVDLKDILEHPIFGKGRSSYTRFGNIGGDRYIFENHRTNGVTDFAVKYGMIGFMLYFILMYKSFKQFCEHNKFNSKFAYLMIITMFTVGFSQALFQHSVFISMIYLMFLYPSYKTNRSVKHVRRNKTNTLYRYSNIQ